MKTSPLRRALLRAWFLALMLSTSARAEWITLQVPLTRATNSFSLWEVAPGTANPGTPFPTAGAGIVETSVSSINFIGGSFDALGNWVPDQNSYALLQAERAGTGDFWLRDATMQEFAPRNQTALTNAPWMASASANGLRLFAIESARASHVFSLQYDDGAIFSMSSSPPQVEYDVQGNAGDLGFFLAWVPDRGPFSGAEWLIDHGTNERTTGSALPSNLAGAAWEPFTGILPTHEVVFLVPTANPGDLFEIAIPGLSTAQVAATTRGGTLPDGSSYLGTGVAGIVGQGYPYRLVRLADGAGSPQFRMGEADAFHQADWLPALPAAQWEQRNFSIVDLLASTGTFCIRYGDGGSTPLTLNFASIQTLYGWDDLGNSMSATLLSYEAMVDVSRPWWLELTRSSATFTYGQNPVLLEGWAPAHLTPPAGSNYVWVPSLRAGRGLRVNQSDSWPAGSTGTTATFSLDSPVGGAPVTWQASLLSATFENFTTPYTLSDPVAGDVSAAADPNVPANFSTWFPAQPLLLKISATRWSKTLVIRTPLGDLPITRHQMLGGWSRDASGLVWFVTYGYFDATATAYEGLPWWLVDKGVAGHPTNEVVSPSPWDANDFIDATDNTNSDTDSLKDWYERLLGTNPYSADTDGDGVNDDIDEDPRTRPATAPGSTLKVYTQLR